MSRIKKNINKLFFISIFILSFCFNHYPAYALFRAEVPGLDAIGAFVSEDIVIPCDSEKILQSSGSGVWACVSSGISIGDAIGSGTASSFLRLDSSGNLADVLNDATTNALSTWGVIGHNSTGTPAADFGSTIKFQLESSTTADTESGSLDVKWTTATHASRVSQIELNPYYIGNKGNGLKVRGAIYDAFWTDGVSAALELILMGQVPLKYFMLELRANQRLF